MTTWPILFKDVLAAETRIRRHVAPTALRGYAPLDAAIGHGVSVLVKHENHNATGSFKLRNAVSALSALDKAARARGVVAASRGNHGLGLAHAGRALGVPVTICVPQGNNPEKNAAIVGYGARLVEAGADYDEATRIADRLVREQGLTLVHSTENRDVIAGAATLTLEILRAEPRIDALVLAIGGGSQAVGALTVARELAPDLRIIGVQAAGASAAHDSWHAGEPKTTASARTFADGLATRQTYAMTFDALRVGLAGFVLVTEAELAAAVRLMISTTHNLVEGAGAAGLAGLVKLAPELAGQRVVIVNSGANIDQATLTRVLSNG